VQSHGLPFQKKQRLIFFKSSIFGTHFDFASMEAAPAATSTHAPAPTEIYENFNVRLASNGSSQIINAHFGCCFFSALGYPSAANQAFASVHQSSNRKEDASGKSFVDVDLTMSLQKPLEGQFVALGHAPKCPARLIQYPEHEKLKQTSTRVIFLRHQKN
jgi:hypothetical protein